MLLLLGAAFVWWLLFSGGPAQAADGGSAHEAFDPVAPVTQTTRTVADSLRTTPRRLTDTVGTTTRTAPKPVRDILDTATAVLEPTLSRTTGTVADTVDTTVSRTVEAVRPALQAVPHPAAPKPSTTPSTPVLRTTASEDSRRHVAATGTAPTTQPTAPGATFVAVPSDARIGHSDGPADPTPSAPAAPAAPVVPGGSTGSAGTPWAALAGLLIVPPATRRRRRTGGRSERRRDPAYTPGCSPD
jgi:hypothetical protein